MATGISIENLNLPLLGIELGIVIVSLLVVTLNFVINNGNRESTNTNTNTINITGDEVKVNDAIPPRYHRF